MTVRLGHHPRAQQSTNRSHIRFASAVLRVSGPFSGLDCEWPATGGASHGTIHLCEIGSYHFPIIISVTPIDSPF